MIRIVFYSVLLTIISIFGFIFAILNAEAITIHYHYGSTSLPLSLVMVLCLIVGAIFGLIASFFTLLKLKREIANLNKQVQIVEQELTNLRSIPLRDC